MRFCLSDGHVKICLRGLEKLWSIHGDFTIPKKNIVSVDDGMPKTSWKELRVPGSFVPGVIKAGTYYTPRGKEFWYVTRWSEAIATIELKNEKYKRLVLGMDRLSREALEKCAG